MDTQTKETRQDRLEKLGLTGAANRQKELLEMKRKLTIACEFYRYVKPEQFAAFNTALRNKTQKESARAYQYDSLVFIPLGQYAEEPPAEVLDELEVALGRNCFDAFEIAKIESVRQVKDPILFGLINGCPDKFYIAQWDDDVKIEQILQDHEG